MELTPSLIFAIGVLAFVCEYVDATLGMGYGTLLTPLLVIMGWAPLQVVPAVLFSQFLAGFIGGFWHHRLGNVALDFRRDTNLHTGHPAKKFFARLGLLGYLPRSRDAKVVFILGGCGIIGALAAVLLAVSIPQRVQEGYIGGMLVALGFLVLVTRRRNLSFSWPRLFFFGFLSAFNKGLSGGGYGPLVASGQMLSGMGSQNAVGNTTLAEALVCLVGFLAYVVTRGGTDWRLALPLVVGATASTPLSAYTVRKVGERKLRGFLAIAILVLGATTLAKGLST